MTTYVSPFASSREIVRAYALDCPSDRQRGRLQYLRKQGVISPGIRRAVRSKGGRVGGTVHLYCQLNRDAATLFRQGDLAAARRLALQAAVIENGETFRLIADALAGAIATQPLDDADPIPTLQRLMDSSGALQEAVAGLAATIATTREAYARLGETSRTFAGVVGQLDAVFATIRTSAGAFTMARDQLHALDLDHLGAAVQVAWEQLDKSDFVFSTGPALRVGVPTDVRPRSVFEPVGSLELNDEEWHDLEDRGNSRPMSAWIPIALPDRDG